MTTHKLYLDLFLDLFNGEAISYGIAKVPSAMNILGALDKAVAVTRDGSYRRTFHSGQRWGY